MKFLIRRLSMLSGFTPKNWPPISRLLVLLLVAGVGRLAANDPPFITDGLIAYFPFDGSVSNAFPSFSKAPVFRNISFATDRFGRPESAARFDGFQSFVMLESFFATNSLTPLTVSLWFRPFTRLQTRNQPVYLIGATGESDNRGIGQSISTGGSLDGPDVGGPYHGLSAFTWLAQRPFARYYASCSQLVFETNRWVHVAATYRTNEINIYVNGILQQSRSLPNQPVTPRNNLVIGAHKYDAGIRWPFFGAIDDVRIYNYSLTEFQVIDLYDHENQGRQASVLAFIDQEGVVDARVADGGYGYRGVPHISFEGPGKGAVVTADITNGIVAGLRILSAGTNYSDQSKILVSKPQRQSMQALAVAKLLNGGAVSITLTDRGFGYTSAPEVIISGGRGVEASAITEITNGIVASVRMLNPGTAYTAPPTITIAPPAPVYRKAEAVSSVAGGTIDYVGLIDSGQGYDTPPTVLLVGGGGSGALAVATVANGVVTGIAVTNPGSGYTATPSVRIASPPFNPSLSVRVKTVRVDLKVVLGRRYQLESSTDLSTWTPAGNPFVAQDELLTQDFDADDTGRFFRINQIP